MRLTSLLLLLGALLGGAPVLRAQSVQWEYGTLTVINGVPFIWSGGDCTHVVDSAIAMIQAQLDLKAQLFGGKRTPSAAAGGTPNHRATPLVAFLNQLGRDGWELVAFTEEPSGSINSSRSATYLFKRRRT